MIAVLADDFTGAAELAGIGLHYNLEVELSIGGAVNTNSDLLVVNTDSRSMNREDAKKITADTVASVLLLKPVLLYKKIDSVFRGHVLEELSIQMQQMQLQKALIIAANPSLGRVIRDGNYFVDEKPVSETSFAFDPEFAITSSSVTAMVKDMDGQVKVLKHTDPLPSKGIVVGEATTGKDIDVWVDKIDDSWALAGAADFFTALLNKRYKRNIQSATGISMPHLYISGTAFENSVAFIKEAGRKRNCVTYIPSSMVKTGNIEEAWLKKLSGILGYQQRAIVAIDNEMELSEVSPLKLRAMMANAVKRIVDRENIREIFIEGGSTASLILKELGFHKLSLVSEIERGVVRMKAGDIYITVKPGSYKLPKQVAELYN